MFGTLIKFQIFFVDQCTFQNALLNHYFLNNLIFKFSTLLFFLSDLFQKYITQLAKKSNWLVDLVFEIFLDSKFLVRGEILKNCMP